MITTGQRWQLGRDRPRIVTALTQCTVVDDDALGTVTFEDKGVRSRLHIVITAVVRWTGGDCARLFDEGDKSCTEGDATILFSSNGSMSVQGKFPDALIDVVVHQLIPLLPQSAAATPEPTWQCVTQQTTGFVGFGLNSDLKLDDAQPRLLEVGSLYGLSLKPPGRPQKQPASPQEQPASPQEQAASPQTKPAVKTIVLTCTGGAAGSEAEAATVQLYRTGAVQISSRTDAGIQRAFDVTRATLANLPLDWTAVPDATAA
jgi:hypothetical protein